MTGTALMMISLIILPVMGLAYVLGFAHGFVHGAENDGTETD